MYNLSTGWGRQDSCKSEANLVYAVSPRWSELVTKQDPVSKIKQSTLVFSSIQHMMIQPASSSEQELVDLSKSSFYRSQTSSRWEGIFTTDVFVQTVAVIPASRSLQRQCWLRLATLHILISDEKKGKSTDKVSIILYLDGVTLTEL